jgi:hypothetical protein
MTPPVYKNKKLIGALISYGVLALIGALTLDGILRGAVLCLMAILAIKTVAHAKKDEGMM